MEVWTIVVAEGIIRKQLDLGYNLKTQPAGFAEGSDMGMAEVRCQGYSRIMARESGMIMDGLQEGWRRKQVAASG